MIIELGFGFVNFENEDVVETIVANKFMNLTDSIMVA
jgi:hypothetical protein